MTGQQIQDRNADLQARFKQCEMWNDAEQWEALAMLYYAAGYVLNAGVCFDRADTCRLWDDFRAAIVAMETPFPELADYYA